MLARKGPVISMITSIFGSRHSHEKTLSHYELRMIPFFKLFSQHQKVMTTTDWRCLSLAQVKMYRRAGDAAIKLILHMITDNAAYVQEVSNNEQLTINVCDRVSGLRTYINNIYNQPSLTPEKYADYIEALFYYCCIVQPKNRCYIKDILDHIIHTPPPPHNPNDLNDDDEDSLSSSSSPSSSASSASSASSSN